MTPDAKRTLVMGVLNVTPDSFYDGGRYAVVDDAVAQARAMIDAGAGVIDVGGESSRPGADPVGAEEEQRRVLPVVEAVAGLDALVSIDTYRASTARLALERGASIVNDITALRGDPAMAAVVAETGCTSILMHMQGTPKTMQEAPRYDDVIGDIRAFFDERIAHARDAGIHESRIWLDPGFGFGKTVAHNLELLRRLRELTVLGRPILMGTSNKSTIGVILDAPVGERTEGTAATVALSIANGADAVRVHNVTAMAKVAKMTDAVVRGHS